MEMKITNGRHAFEYIKSNNPFFAQLLTQFSFSFSSKKSYTNSSTGDKVFLFAQIGQKISAITATTTAADFGQRLDHPLLWACRLPRHCCSHPFPLQRSKLRHISYLTDPHLTTNSNRYIQLTHTTTLTSALPLKLLQHLLINRQGSGVLIRSLSFGKPIA